MAEGRDRVNEEKPPADGSDPTVQRSARGPNRRTLLTQGVRWGMGLGLACCLGGQSDGALHAEPARSGPPLPTGPLRLNLLITGALDGATEPCGCPGGPSGGFSRRTAYVRSLAGEGEAMVQLDAGNALLKTSLSSEPPTLVGAGPRVDPMTFGQKMARLMAASGIQAAAVGPRDLSAVGVGPLLALARETRLQWLSANLLDAQGKLLFPASTIFRTGGIRLGVVGVTDPQVGLLERLGVRVQPVLESLKAAAAALRGQTDVLVLLSNLSYEEQESLRDELPEYELVFLGGPAGTRLKRVGEVAPVVMVVPGEGRQLVRVALRITPPAPGKARLPLMFSAGLDRRLSNLASAQRVYQDFARDIEEELGRPDPARLSRDTESLRVELAALRTEPADPPGTRTFATTSIPLDERVGEDPNLQALMKTPDGRMSSPETPTRKPRPAP